MGDWESPEITEEGVGKGEVVAVAVTVEAMVLKGVEVEEADREPPPKAVEVGAPVKVMVTTAEGVRVGGEVGEVRGEVPKVDVTWAEAEAVVVGEMERVGSPVTVYCAEAVVERDMEEDVVGVEEIEPEVEVMGDVEGVEDTL